MKKSTVVQILKILFLETDPSSDLLGIDGYTNRVVTRISVLGINEVCKRPYGLVQDLDIMISLLLDLLNLIMGQNMRPEIDEPHKIQREDNISERHRLRVERHLALDTVSRHVKKISRIDYRTEITLVIDLNKTHLLIRSKVQAVAVYGIFTVP